MDENPHTLSEAYFHYKFSVNVWDEILEEYLVGQ